MNFLKRGLAPLTDRAWETIEEEAVRVLKANLSGRHVVDLEGLLGFDVSAVNLGRLSPADQTTEQGVHYGIRSVLPLVELRVPFELDVWELDNLSRGADDPDVEALIQAALKLAHFEEQAIYSGFPPGNIKGLAESKAHAPLTLGDDAARYPDIITRAMLMLNDEGVNGPYALVLGPRPYRLLSGDASVYPLRQRVARLIDGPILHTTAGDGGFLLSARGGDFQLTVGQDISIGYDWHDQRKASLYLTESFTFRVLTPEAVVPLVMT